MEVMVMRMGQIMKKNWGYKLMGAWWWPKIQLGNKI